MKLLQSKAKVCKLLDYKPCKLSHENLLRTQVREFSNACQDFGRQSTTSVKFTFGVIFHETLVVNGPVN